jgi:hypothetical protein
MQTCGVDYAATFSCLVVVREAEAGRPSSAPAHPRFVSPKLTQVGTNPTGLHAPGYLERNEGALVHYAARRRHGEPISTAFVESAVNEIVAKRMNKKQQMRWNRATVQPFLDVRAAMLNDTLEDAFRRRYSGFRPVNDGEATATAA